MKTMSAVLALALLLFATLVSAQSNAVATTVTGSAQVQTGMATPRALRLGDVVRQGDTVSTGAASAVVLKFTDGHVAALTSTSRMTITAYQYNAAAGTGNVLLSLVYGGMRAITGLIGRNQPQQVAYRAANATIGIRGTDTIIATDETQVAAVVNDGEITFTYQGQTLMIPTGQAAFGANGRVTAGAAAMILAQLPPALQQAIGGLAGLGAEINAAKR